jgi:hypothetical protein
MRRPWNNGRARSVQSGNTGSKSMDHAQTYSSAGFAQLETYLSFRENASCTVIRHRTYGFRLYNQEYIGLNSINKKQTSHRKMLCQRKVCTCGQAVLREVGSFLLKYKCTLTFSTWSKTKDICKAFSNFEFKYFIR